MIITHSKNTFKSINKIDTVRNWEETRNKIITLAVPKMFRAIEKPKISRKKTLVDALIAGNILKGIFQHVELTKQNNTVEEQKTCSTIFLGVTQAVHRVLNKSLNYKPSCQNKT